VGNSFLLLLVLSLIWFEAEPIWIFTGPFLLWLLLLWPIWLAIKKWHEEIEDVKWEKLLQEYHPLKQQELSLTPDDKLRLKELSTVVHLKSMENLGHLKIMGMPIWSRIFWSLSPIWKSPYTESMKQLKRKRSPKAWAIK
jgi:hypothetical protein